MNLIKVVFNYFIVMKIVLDFQNLNVYYFINCIKQR